MIVALKINVRNWQKITAWSHYYDHWTEKAKKINSDIGDLETYHLSKHYWTTYIRQRPYAAFDFGFDDNGNFYQKMLTTKYKDPQKKIFSATEVEEIVQSVLKALNAFSDAGILEEH